MHLMLGRELRLPDAIILEEPPLHKEMSTDYALAPQDKMKKCGNQLRNYQYVLFVAGDHSLAKESSKAKRGEP